MVMTGTMGSGTRQSEKGYLPAAGIDWALPLYDPLVKVIGAENAKRELLEMAGLRSSHRVLDIGCGTGTLATLIKKTYPAAQIVGLDPDPKALARALRKANRAGVTVRFDRGFADELPYAPASFDRVFSSFMFHHLPAEKREPTLREVRRVLAPGGSFHLLDFERPNPGDGFLARLMHSNEHLEENSEERILELMRRAGLAGATRVSGGSLFFGLARIGYFRASAE